MKALTTNQLYFYSTEAQVSAALLGLGVVGFIFGRERFGAHAGDRLAPAALAALIALTAVVLLCSVVLFGNANGVSVHASRAFAAIGVVPSARLPRPTVNHNERSNIQRRALTFLTLASIAAVAAVHKSQLGFGDFLLATAALASGIASGVFAVSEATKLAHVEVRGDWKTDYDLSEEVFEVALESDTFVDEWRLFVRLPEGVNVVSRPSAATVSEPHPVDLYRVYELSSPSVGPLFASRPMSAFGLSRMSVAKHVGEELNWSVGGKFVRARSGTIALPAKSK